MRDLNKALLRWMLAGAISLATAGLASAQTPPATGEGEPRLPRVSVSTASSNAPGLWLGQSRSRSSAFQQASLHDFGGATIGPASGELGRWQQFEVTSVQAVFDFLNDLADQLVLALSLQKATATTGG